MSTELYLDTARLGRMCRGAQTAEQQFNWLVGQHGSSLYVERFLIGGHSALPNRLQRRYATLRCWPGVCGLQQALGRFIRQPAGLPTHFFGQSCGLIRYAAQCLFAQASRVLVTDLVWPGYLNVLRQVASENGRALHTVPVRQLIMSDRADADQVARYLADAYERSSCDGMFLTDISHLGIRLPLERLFGSLSASRTRFVVVDGAQAFHHRVVDLSRLPCDLYLAGTQKWFGAYHPLRIAFTGRSENLEAIEAAGRHPFQGRQVGDALFDFCSAHQNVRLTPFGETVHVAPLIAAAGALRHARRERAFVEHRWQRLLRNARTLANWFDDACWRPVELHDSLDSGILLLACPTRARSGFVSAARAALARCGVVASAFPEGVLRFSMPRHDLCLQHQTFIWRAVRQAFE